MIKTITALIGIKDNYVLLENKYDFLNTNIRKETL